MAWTAWLLKNGKKIESSGTENGWIDEDGQILGFLSLDDYSFLPILLFETLTSKVIKNKRTEIKLPKWIFKYETFYLIKGSQQIFMKKNSKNIFENSFKTYKGI